MAKKIFISSTAYDLIDLRAEVVSALTQWGFQTLNHEHPEFPVLPGIHSHDICIEAVKQCDIFLLIIDKRYGGKYSGSNTLYKDKNMSVTHNAYVDFISQLYEFYLGFAGGRKGRLVDLFINNEVRKLLKIKRDRILRGDAPSWENHISYYEVEVPEEFGYNFRTVRNHRSHADSLRALFDLSEFFKKYHKFVYLLYEEPQWLWNRENVKEYDWLQIERFAETLSKK